MKEKNGGLLRALSQRVWARPVLLLLPAEELLHFWIPLCSSESPQLMDE
jgi:hypothetical protein